MIRLSESDVGVEELEAVEQCFDRQWLGSGEKTEEFERQMADFLGVDDFVFVNSGSNALQLAVKILDLPHGSEVILPSFTWMTCANAVLLNGLRPVFCDVDTSTGNITAEHVAKKLTPKTSAIMVVHYAGKPVDMDSIRTFKLPIIEDAAHAVDSRYKGQSCGTIGHVGIFSFDAMKNLTTGEGGGVVAREPAKMQRARSLRYSGIEKSGVEVASSKDRWWEYDIHGVFPKMLNTDVAAAIGIAQLDKLEAMQMRRRKIWSMYNSVLSTEDWLELPPNPESYELHSYFTYQIKVRHRLRDRLARYLYDRKIYTTLRFHPLHLKPVYNQQDASLPNCEWLNEVALNLPLHSRLNECNVYHVLTTLIAFRKAL